MKRGIGKGGMERRYGKSDVRKSVQGKGGESQAVGADGVVHDLWWIKVKERSPSDGVEALEQEHHGDVAIDEALGCAVWVISVLLGGTADNE